jgi:hypothetical protein
MRECVRKRRRIAGLAERGRNFHRDERRVVRQGVGCWKEVIVGSRGGGGGYNGNGVNAFKVDVMRMVALKEKSGKVESIREGVKRTWRKKQLVEIHIGHFFLASRAGFMKRCAKIQCGMRGQGHRFSKLRAKMSWVEKPRRVVEYRAREGDGGAGVRG